MKNNLIHSRPFVSFLCSFLSDESVPCTAMSDDIRSVRFEHVQKFPSDKTDREVRFMYGLHPLSLGLFGTRA